jgi:hypothetical protein
VKDLEPEQSQSVNITLDKHYISFWHDTLGVWVADRGEYKVWVGSSSNDLRLVARLRVQRSFEWSSYEIIGLVTEIRIKDTSCYNL